VGIPLIACSLLALGIIIERAVNLKYSRLMRRDLLRGTESLVEAGDVEGSLRLARATSGPLAAILAAGLEAHADPPEVLRDTVQEAARHEAPVLERHLGLLGTVASIAPMLGLLGTVSGMVQTFGEIAVTGVGEAKALAGGIFEALFTTIAGLVVAIPALAAYNYYAEKVGKALIDMEREALRLARHLRPSAVK
jgi:biopolymer transport protein ExbB